MVNFPAKVYTQNARNSKFELSKKIIKYQNNKFSDNKTIKQFT